MTCLSKKKKSYMKTAWSKYLLNQHKENAYTWFWTKLLMVTYWLVSNGLIWIEEPAINYPKGICLLIPCESVNMPLIRFSLVLFALIGIAFYLMEKKMIIALLLLSFCSILTFSLRYSNGVGNINNFSSMIFVAQLLAYSYHSFHHSTQKLFKTRIQFVVQVICAYYVLAALSKLSHGGFSWFNEYQGFAIQVKKSQLMGYYTSGEKSFLHHANLFYNFFIDHPIITKLGLFIAHFLEFFIFILLFTDRAKVIYGWLLIFMHWGIFLIMDIDYSPIHLYLYFVNIPLLISCLHNYVIDKFSIKKIKTQ